MKNLQAMPRDVELTWRKIEQSLREQRESLGRELNEQNCRLLEEMSARYADIEVFKFPPILPVLSPEESARTMKMLRDVERALERLPPALQDAFWDLPLDDGFFDAVAIVLNSNLTDKQRATELATFFAGGEVESSWLQLRRALYPVVKDVSNVETLFISGLFSHLGKDDLFVCLCLLAVLVIIYRSGDPEKPT